MEYWNDFLTEKSWKILNEIKGEFEFVLIGGWAVYLWGKVNKSKDLNIIISFDVLNKLREKYDVKKNDKLKKYEIKIEEIDIDIYVPFYSEIGIDLKKIETEKVEGFDVVKVEELLIMKQIAERERKGEKKEKDGVDILSLLFNCDIDFGRYNKLLKEFKKEELFRELINLVKNFKEGKYFDLNVRELKLKKNEVLDKLR